MNIEEILEEYLEENGFDGLRNGCNKCCCSLHEILFPCESFDAFNDCEPGYKVPWSPDGRPVKDYNVDGDYSITTEKPKR